MYSFAHLSDEELVEQLKTFCFDLRRHKVHVLAVLGEVEERRIHLLAAASSVWDYCRNQLQMSHGSAYRFMKGAELCKRFPFLLEGIDRGKIHLTTLVHIASFITDENVHELVEETRGKNRCQVDLVLLRRFGREPSKGRDVDPMPYDEELLDLMQRAFELTSHSVAITDRLELTKVAYRVFIAHLEKSKRAKADNPRPAPSEPTTSISRHASREMFERDGDQCSYVDGRTGARCQSRAFIQRDHVHMRVHGGTHDAKNLRPMCAAHNRLLAELALGRKNVERRIRSRQRKDSAKNAKKSKGGGGDFR